MNCSKAEKLLLRQAEGALDERTSSCLEQHLAACERCTQEMADLREMRGVLLSVRTPAPKPSVDFHSRLAAELRKDTGRQAKRWPAILSWPVPRPSWALATAGAAALVAVAGYLHVLPELQTGTYKTAGAPPAATVRTAPSPDATLPSVASKRAAAEKSPRTSSAHGLRIGRNPERSSALHPGGTLKQRPASPALPEQAATDKRPSVYTRLPERIAGLPVSASGMSATEKDTTLEAVPEDTTPGRVTKPLSAMRGAATGGSIAPMAAAPVTGSLPPSLGFGEDRAFHVAANREPEDDSRASARGIAERADAVQMVYGSIDARARALFTY